MGRKETNWCDACGVVTDELIWTTVRIQNGVLHKEFSCCRACRESLAKIIAEICERFVVSKDGPRDA